MHRKMTANTDIRDVYGDVYIVKAATNGRPGTIIRNLRV